MKSSLPKAKGFTLIELVVVIVILGIMAAIAGPKFADLQKDARFSVMQGVEGAIRSTATLAYSKSLIAGDEGDAEGAGVQVVMGGVNVLTDFGYPTVVGLVAGMDLAGDVTSASADGETITFTYGPAGGTCTVTYLEAANDTTPPVITLTPADSSTC